MVNHFGTQVSLEIISFDIHDHESIENISIQNDQEFHFIEIIITYFQKYTDNESTFQESC